MKKLRKSERFEDFGRVESDELCLVNGVLEDISATGLKVSYSIPPTVDMEKEYEIKLRLSRVAEDALVLMVKPMRVEQEEDQTSVGFLLLHSKDSARPESYVNLLKEEAQSTNEKIAPQVDETSLFI
ncbi:MAG: PilZ domain-containing protein [Treponema sp.]|nr:PilZ domain-containing protein [Candidatus Treponema equifaecale]